MTPAEAATRIAYAGTTTGSGTKAGTHGNAASETPRPSGCAREVRVIRGRRQRVRQTVGDPVSRKNILTGKLNPESSSISHKFVPVVLSSGPTRNVF